MKGEKGLDVSQNPNRKSHAKICSKTSYICTFSKEKCSRILGFVNPVLNSDDKDDDIFKPE